MKEVNNESSTFEAHEAQRLLQESLKLQNPESIENPALKRCLEQPFNPEKEARQAYDRMHHTHNRS